MQLQHMSIQLLSIFHHKAGYSQTFQLVSIMLQCNEHVEMIKFGKFGMHLDDNNV